MQLRYLQTLTKIAGDKTSTIVFPLPMDLLGPLLQAARGHRDAGDCGPAAHLTGAERAGSIPTVLRRSPSPAHSESPCAA